MITSQKQRNSAQAIREQAQPWAIDLTTHNSPSPSVCYVLCSTLYVLCSILCVCVCSTLYVLLTLPVYEWEMFTTLAHRVNLHCCTQREQRNRPSGEIELQLELAVLLFYWPLLLPSQAETMYQMSIHRDTRSSLTGPTGQEPFGGKITKFMHISSTNVHTVFSRERERERVKTQPTTIDRIKCTQIQTHSHWTCQVVEWRAEGNDIRH